MNPSPEPIPGRPAAGSDAVSARLRRWSVVVLSIVAAAGAVLSYRSLYEYAVPLFGPVLAVGFPVLVDFLVLGASLAYVAGARVGRPQAGWRLTAHAGVAGTIVLNALAAASPAEVPLHVTAPIVWSVLVEMTAREVLGQWRAVHVVPADRIPLTLWASAPMESARTALLMARTGTTNATTARTLVGVHAAAREALTLALPSLSARSARRVLRRQLRAGSLTPAAALDAIGWTGPTTGTVDPADAVRAALRAVITTDTAAGPKRSEALTSHEPSRHEHHDGPEGLTGDINPGLIRGHEFIDALPHEDKAPGGNPALELGIHLQPDVRLRSRLNRGSHSDTAVAVARIARRNPALSAAEIAARLDVHPSTVRRHRAALNKPSTTASATGAPTPTTSTRARTTAAPTSTDATGAADDTTDPGAPASRAA